MRCNRPESHKEKFYELQNMDAHQRSDFVAALGGPGQLAGQGPTKRPRYKLIDLGTLGGPHSYGSINGDGFQLLNNSGV